MGMFGEAWTEVLREYSRLEMTKKTDILLALSGLAKFVKHLIPGRYIAGLWERDIAFQLAWSINSPKTSIHRNVLDGPSFSWVATNRLVYWGSYRSRYAPRCTFVTSTNRLATTNPYGDILASSITLTGLILGSSELMLILEEFVEEMVEDGWEHAEDAEEQFR